MLPFGKPSGEVSGNTQELELKLAEIGVSKLLYQLDQLALSSQEYPLVDSCYFGGLGRISANITLFLSIKTLFSEIVSIQIAL